MLFLLHSPGLSAQELLLQGWWPAESASPPALEQLQSSPPLPATLSADSARWVLLRLSVPEGQAWYLQTAEWAKVLAWQSDSFGQWQWLGQTGRLLPVSERSFPYSRQLIPLPFQRATSYYVLLYTDPGYGLFQEQNVRLSLISRTELEQEERQRLLSQGIFIGIILVMFLHNLLIYLSEKDRSYLYYVLSLLGIGAYFFFYYGFALEYLWPESPRWDVHSFALIVPLTGMARLMFARNYLSTRHHLPFWNRLLLWLTAAHLLPIISGVLGFWLSGPWLLWSVGLIAVVNVTASGVTIGAGVAALFRQDRESRGPARLFLWAYVPFVMGSLPFILKEVNLLPDLPLTRYAVQIGMGIQVVLFSMGLAARLRQTRAALALEVLENARLEAEKQAERKKLIEKQKEELEWQVRLRTDELQAAVLKLRQSEQELRDSNRVKDRLFSIISHDLKSPLVTLDSFLNLLVRHTHRLSAEEMQKLTEKTRSALRNLSLLLENLLQWSRLQLDHLPFNPQPTDAGELVQRAVRLFEAAAEEKGIRLVQEVEGPIVWADPDMAAFTVRNLLHNAIKFTPKHGTIRIFCREYQSMLEISISDTGRGIAPAELQALMRQKTFSQLGTEQEKGTGLGLMMCIDFVEKNGGTLRAESTPGSGSCFTFSLPLYQPA